MQRPVARSYSNRPHRCRTNWTPIDICRGYVEAQHEYALQPREGFESINTPAHYKQSGKQDGLAWQNPDGSWADQLANKIARP